MKKGVYFIIGLSVIIALVFVLGIGVDKTKAYHNSTNVSIGIDSLDKTIDAIAVSNFVFPSHTYTSVLSLNPGHNTNQIWVSVKDGEMNLSAALSSTNKLCPANPIKTSYASSPTDKTQPYHFANEIQLASGKNLQEAIDNGDFCYFWYTDTSLCSAICGGGTRTTYCNHSGVQVADSYCYGTKPSVSCNTQGCVWRILPGRGCVPATVSCSGSYCCSSYNPGGQACSPAGTFCMVLGGQCDVAPSTAIYRYNCTA